MSQIDIARAIAVVAHYGQVDKAGEPYISHPRRVAEALEYEWRDSPQRQEELVATAWLHDVLEDSDILVDHLILAGVSDPIIEAVQVLTHQKNEPRADYYARVRQSWIALRVKRMDVADNSDPARLAKLDDDTIARLVRKYAEATEALK